MQRFKNSAPNYTPILLLLPQRILFQKHFSVSNIYYKLLLFTVPLRKTRGGGGIIILAYQASLTKRVKNLVCMWLIRHIATETQSGHPVQISMAQSKRRLSKSDIEASQWKHESYMSKRTYGIRRY